MLVIFRQVRFSQTVLPRAHRFQVAHRRAAPEMADAPVRIGPRRQAGQQRIRKAEEIHEVEAGAHQETGEPDGADLHRQPLALHFGSRPQPLRGLHPVELVEAAAGAAFAPKPVEWK